MTENINTWIVYLQKKNDLLQECFTFKCNEVEFKELKKKALETYTNTGVTVNRITICCKNKTGYFKISDDNVLNICLKNSNPPIGLK